MNKKEKIERVLDFLENDGPVHEVEIMFENGNTYIKIVNPDQPSKLQRRLRKKFDDVPISQKNPDGPNQYVYVEFYNTNVGEYLKL